MAVLILVACYSLMSSPCVPLPLQTSPLIICVPSLVTIVMPLLHPIRPGLRKGMPQCKCQTYIRALSFDESESHL